MGFWRDLWFGRPRDDVRTIGDEEQRAVTGLPFAYGGTLDSEVTQDRALALAPVFAAARILAGTVSTLPLKPYRKIGDERIPMGSLPQLFAQLDVDGELVPWLHKCMTSLVLRGNAYGLVTARDGFQFPTRIDWLNPSDVTVDDYRSTIRPVWFWRGREVPREDIVHIPWFTIPGMTEGLSPIGAFKATISTGLAAQDYGKTWFDNGGFPPGTFQNMEKTVPQEEAEEIKGRLRRAMLTRSPLVYGKDWKYDPVTVPPEEAQFIETLRLSANQVAAIYGLPPEDVGGSRGGSLTYSTVELNQLDRALAIRPWLTVIEHKFASLLPERQYVRFNADAMVRTDLKTRWEVHEIAKRIGAHSVDEIRALEDEPPLPNGIGEQYQTPAVNAAPPQSPDDRAPNTVRRLPG